MRLNQEKIERMFNARGSMAGGGGGGSESIAGLASQVWTEENYVSKAFFNELFIIHKKTTTTVYDGDVVVSTTVDTSGVFSPNEVPSQTESTDAQTGYRTVVETEVDNIEAKKGLWTDYFLSALGLNSSGGGGGSETLAGLLDVELDSPVSNQVLTYYNGKWRNMSAPGVDMNAVWQALGDTTTTQQIAHSHLTTALNGYATQLWVGQQGFLTSADLSGYATQTWVTNNFSTPTTVATQMQTYAKIQNGTITIGDASLTPITSVSGTFWGNSWTNGGTVTGSLTGVVQIDMTGHLVMHSGGTGIYLNSDGTGIDWHNAAGEYVSSLIAFTSAQVQINQDLYIPSPKIVRIGDAVLVWDGDNNSLKLRHASGANASVNFYATGGVSALGYGSGGGGGVGDVTWELLADNTDTRPIALSHLTGALAGYATTSQLAGYVTIAGNETITGLKTMSHGLVVQGRVYGSGDDEGILIKPASNNMAGITLGVGYHDAHCTLYFTGTSVENYDSFWRFRTGSPIANYDIHHPKKGGVIALVSDIPTDNSQLTNGAGYVTSSGSCASALSLDYMPVISSLEALDAAHYASKISAFRFRDFSIPILSNNGIVIDIGWDSAAYGAQLVIDDDPTYIFGLRQRNRGGWSDWKRIPMGDGTGASGTWGISISGNAATATTATTATNAGNADTLDGYHASYGSNAPWGTIPVIHANGWIDIGKQIEFHYDNTTASDYSTLLRCTGNHNNIVDLPSGNGTLALTSQFDDYVTLATEQTISGKKTITSILTVKAPIFGYNYNAAGANVAAFILDKPGSNATGIGAHTSNDVIWFGACNGSGAWIDTYKQIWDFNGTIRQEGNNVIHAGNIASQTVASCTGNAGSATKLATARTIWSQSFDGTGNVSGALLGAGGYIDLQNNDEINRYGGPLCIQHRGNEDGTTGQGTGGTVTGNVYMCAHGGQVAIGTRTINTSHRFVVNGAVRADWFASTVATGTAPFSVSSTTVVTNLTAEFATKLATPRTIWNQSFDGSADVTGSIYLPENTPHYFRLPTNATWRGGIFWGSSGYECMAFVARDSKSSFMFANNSDIASWSSNTYTTITSPLLYIGTNVGVGTNSPSYKLHVAGTIYSSTDITANNALYVGQGIILNPAGAATTNGGFLDFRYAGAGSYTSRIIEDASGRLYLSATNGVRIGDAVLRWESGNNALRIESPTGGAVNLYTTGGLSALGISGAVDGTVNASLIPSATGTYTLGNTSYRWKELYLASTNGSYNGKIYVDYDGINLDSANGGYFSGSRFLINGRLAVGTDSDDQPTYDLYVAGNTYVEGSNAYFYGNVSVQSLTQRSDMRIKDVISDMTLKISTIAQAPLFRYKLKQGDGTVMVGSSAQYWDALLPEVIHRDADGILGLDYGVTALASVISVAKEVTEHERRIARLEAENAILRAQIEDLKAA